jgi:hypothetical protein
LATGVLFPNGKEGNEMLRICHSDTTDGHRWSLSGRVAGPWVEEFRACWRQALERTPLAPAVVDLNDVTFIDDAGERLIADMLSAGTEFIVTGVANKYLLEDLQHHGGRRLARTVKESNASIVEPRPLRKEITES